MIKPIPKNNAKINVKLILFLGLLIVIGITIYNKQLVKEKPLKIICIFKNMDAENGFWQSVMEGANLAATEYGAELSIRGAEKEDDYVTQNRLIAEAIAEKPGAIVLAAADYNETCDMAKEIVNNHIKLILIDSTVKEDLADAVISTNNYQAGIRMGAVMKRLLGENQKIGIISHVKGTSTAIDREEGIRMGLSDDKDKIVSVFYCDSDTEKAASLTKDMLKQHPDITVIAGLNQYASVGAGDAIKELGLEESIKIIGFDNARDQITYLEEGIYEAIVIQKSFNMGYLGVESAVKLLKGEKVEQIIDSGSALITKENMYTSLNQKLLFPFD
jgi:ribose transport system substrate-binding protein